MIISVNDEVILTLSDADLKVLQNDISIDKLEQDIKDRIKYTITHKIEQSLKSLKTEWVDSGKLKSKGIEFIPTDDKALADLIISQPEYKDMKERTKNSEVVNLSDSPT